MVSMTKACCWFDILAVSGLGRPPLRISGFCWPRLPGTWAQAVYREKMLVVNEILSHGFNLF